MAKRKARTKLIKKMDILKPIDIETIGTKKDPCFGKHHSPKADECRRCGDSEICAIVKSQKLSVKRAEVEAKQKFKDLEQKDIPQPDKKLISKMVRQRIVELIKRSGEVGITATKLIQETHVVFFQRGYTHTRIKKLLEKMTAKTSRFKFDTKTDKYKWNKA